MIKRIDSVTCGNPKKLETKMLCNWPSRRGMESNKLTRLPKCISWSARMPLCVRMKTASPVTVGPYLVRAAVNYESLFMNQFR